MKAWTGAWLGGCAIALVAASATAFACKGYQENETVEIPTLDSKRLARLLRSEKPPFVLDANGVATRAKYGVIPGARLLSHYADYSVAKELPPTRDSALVFYCGGKRCNAAEKSARKALKSGYENVSVLVGGITGWSESGQVTEPLKPQS
ncbi:MAG: rhodanese-like domain-containing protein [Myxococcota bacterium]